MMASKNQATAIPDYHDYCDSCMDWSSVAQRLSNLALGNAAKKGCLECVNTAIAAGADVNATVESTGNTVLLEASKKGHINCVKSLVDAGADVNIIGKNTGNI